MHHLSGCRQIFDGPGTQQGQKHLEVLDGVGHWHCVEAPEAVSHHMLGFLKQFQELTAE